MSTESDKVTLYLKDIPETYLGTSCLICGESTKYTAEEALDIINGYSRGKIKICDECKEAVMSLRGLLEHLNKEKK